MGFINSKLIKQLAAFVVPILLFMICISIYTLNNKLSFISIIKLLFIVLLAIFNLYLIYLEVHNPNKEALTYKQSGLNSFKGFKAQVAIIIYSITLYSSFVTIHSAHNDKKQMDKYKSEYEEILKVKSRLYQFYIDKENLISKYYAYAAGLDTQFASFYKAIDQIVSLVNEINDTKTLLSSKEIEGNISKLEQIKYELSNLETTKEQLEHEINKSRNSIESEISELQNYEAANDSDNSILDVVNNLKKSSMFDLHELFNSLEGYHQMALSLLVLNTVIISSVISIGFILYGDHLITKYNLETRYPKLARLIQLRRKYQKYNIIISVSLIIYCALAQIIFCIAILTL